MTTSTADHVQPVAGAQPEVVAQANRRLQKIRRAAKMAGFNGWITGILAVLSAPFALFGTEGLLVTAGLAIVAYNELRGRRRLLQFEPAAATHLGWNQLGFLTLIVIYCLWMMFTNLSSTSPLASTIASTPELRDVMGSLDEFEGLYRLLIVAFYLAVILLSATFQGLNALYYFTRRKHIETYLQDTPLWLTDVQRMTISA